MKEIYAFCEGPTEQGFCRQVLSPHLFPGGDGCIHTVKIAHSKHHGKVSRGGVGKYASLRRDIQNTLKQRGSPDVYFTSLIDLYALPGDFPGRESQTRNPSDPWPYASALEKAFGDDIGDMRFVPHVQLHEYETLLFADPDAFRISFESCDDAVQKLKDIAASHASIEQINDGRGTAPSKRIIDLLPRYDGLKPSAGPDIAAFIGMPVLRAKCRHFDAWVTRLENLNWTKQ